MRLGGMVSKRSALALACVAGAVILLAAALMAPKPGTAREEWLPLNAEVREALGQLEGRNLGSENGPDQAKGSDMTAGDAGSGTGGGAAAGDAGSGTGGGAADGEAGSGTGGGAAGSDVGSGSGGVAVGGGIGSGTGGVAAGGDAGAHGKLDINRATAAELETLKGIGPAKAKAIIEERERGGYFRSVDDLLRVKGIGAKLLAGVKESVVANP